MDENKGKLDGMWLICAALLPVVGLIGGLYYTAKNREGADKVLILSIVMLMFYTAVYILRGK